MPRLKYTNLTQNTIQSFKRREGKMTEYTFSRPVTAAARCTTRQVDHWDHVFEFREGHFSMFIYCFTVAEALQMTDPHSR
jgi:hypothetical protein